MNYPTDALSVEPAQVTTIARNGAAPRRLPISMNRAEFDAMLRRDDIKLAAPKDGRAWLNSVVVHILGDKE